MTIGFKFLKDLGIKAAAESITREALIRELKQSNDTQVESESGTMHMHASLTIYSQELTVFLGYNNQQLMSDLTDWYDCRDKWTYRTKNMGTDEIFGVWVNLFGATTPDLLQTTMPRDAIGGGLTSRMIFVYENKKAKTVICPMLSKEEEEIGRKLEHDLQRIALMAGEFKVTPDFIDAWSKWYSETDRNPPVFSDYRFAGYVERRPTHLLKLSMIVSASRSDDKLITGEDFQKALDILTRTERKMPLTFSGLGKFKDSDTMNRIMGIIKENQEMRFSQLQRMLYRDVDKIALTAIVKTLEIMEFLDIIYSPGDMILKAREEFIEPS